MNRGLIIGAAVLLVALGIWQKDALREAWEQRGARQAQEEDFDEEDFDMELEDIENELEDAEFEGSSEFEDLEMQE